MKRITTTLTSAALAGALVFAAVPQAQAISYDQLKVFVENPPQAFLDEDGKYFKLVVDQYVETELPPSSAEAAAAPTLVQNADGSWAVKGNAAYAENPAPAATIEDLVGTVTPTEAVTGELSVAATTEVVAPAPVRNARCGETIWYRTADGKFYVSDQALVTGEIPAGSDKAITAADMEKKVQTDKDCALVEGIPVAQPSIAQPTVAATATLSPGAIAGIAAAAIGVPLVIAGVTYFLNQDGRTLVGSLDRVNAQPTDKERAESDRIRAEHAAEVAAAEAAAAANRGIAAETGSNTLARTLAGLVIALVLGSAAFFAGRRFLV